MSMFVDKLLIIVTALICSRDAFEQVHLSLGYDDTSVVATFHSRIPLQNCTVSYREKNELKSYFQVDCQEDSLGKFSSVYTYRALLTDLKPEQSYYYQIIDDIHESNVYTYRPWNNTLKTSWAIFGDLGLENAVSLPLLERHVQDNRYSVVFHIGDIAYNLHERSGEQGNDFMKMIEPIASSVPYMVCAGNHERHANFTHYDFRYSMLQNRTEESEFKKINNYYYSFDLGEAHVVVFDTEFYYYPELRGWHKIREQFEWLEQDLERANRNRGKTPWLIVMGHRPLYCFRLKDVRSCENNALERVKIRRGIQMYNDASRPREYGLEELFYRHGVDVQFYGHEHHYARTFPLYENSSQIEVSLHEHHDPLAPVHIVTGSAGNREEHPPVNLKIFEQQWLAVHSFDYGFTTLRFVQPLGVQIQQISTDRNDVIDTLTLFKSQPTPAWKR